MVKHYHFTHLGFGIIMFVESFYLLVKSSMFDGEIPEVLILKSPSRPFVMFESAHFPVAFPSIFWCPAKWQVMSAAIFSSLTFLGLGLAGGDGQTLMIRWGIALPNIWLVVWLPFFIFPEILGF